MKYFIFLLLTCLQNIQLNAQHPFNDPFDSNLNNWISTTLLTPTPKKNARTAILIIAPTTMPSCTIGQRWMLGKKAWEQYMNSHPDIDCYFLQSVFPRSTHATDNQVWIEGNTIYIGDWWYEKYGNDRLLHKTIAALKFLLPNYTHFIRTNLNTFVNLHGVHEYMSTHHQSMYTAPLWQSSWYTIGYGIIFTQDVAAHICSEYERLEKADEELISCYHSDDGALTALATGVWPYDKIHPFKCCPSLPFGMKQAMSMDSVGSAPINPYGVLLIPPITLEEAIKRSNQSLNTLILYRIRNELQINELAQLYQYLLLKYYPNLSHIDLTQ